VCQENGASSFSKQTTFRCQRKLGSILEVNAEGSDELPEPTVLMSTAAARCVSWTSKPD